MTRSIKERQRREMKSRMKELLLFIPNLLWLLFGLLRDERVSRADKAILAGTILYVISPLDIIPDFIPFIGQVDDAYLIAISLIRLMNRTDGEVFREHWRGSIDLKDLVTSISTAAEYFLPRKIKNVLRGRIERPSAEAA
ncbi:MAG TPA: YkvA family protein [Blastocatellia bacterium]|nr:YkvA family protein [Blastocatellia bacterium]